MNRLSDSGWSALPLDNSYLSIRREGGCIANGQIFEHLLSHVTLRPLLVVRRLDNRGVFYLSDMGFIFVGDVGCRRIDRWWHIFAKPQFGDDVPISLS